MSKLNKENYDITPVYNYLQTAKELFDIRIQRNDIDGTGFGDKFGEVLNFLFTVKDPAETSTLLEVENQKFDQLLEKYREVEELKGTNNNDITLVNHLKFIYQNARGNIDTAFKMVDFEIAIWQKLAESHRPLKVKADMYRHAMRNIPKDKDKLDFVDQINRQDDELLTILYQHNLNEDDIQVIFEGAIKNYRTQEERVAFVQSVIEEFEARKQHQKVITDPVENSGATITIRDLVQRIRELAANIGIQGEIGTSYINNLLDQKYSSIKDNLNPQNVSTIMKYFNRLFKHDLEQQKAQQQQDDLRSDTIMRIRGLYLSYNRPVTDERIIARINKQFGNLISQSGFTKDISDRIINYFTARLSSAKSSKSSNVFESDDEYALEEPHQQQQQQQKPLPIPQINYPPQQQEEVHNEEEQHQEEEQQQEENQKYSQQELIQKINDIFKEYGFDDRYENLEGEDKAGLDEMISNSSTQDEALESIRQKVSELYESKNQQKLEEQQELAQYQEEKRQREIAKYSNNQQQEQEQEQEEQQAEPQQQQEEQQQAEAPPQQHEEEEQQHEEEEEQPILNDEEIRNRNNFVAKWNRHNLYKIEEDSFVDNFVKYFEPGPAPGQMLNSRKMEFYNKIYELELHRHYYWINVSHYKLDLNNVTDNKTYILNDYNQLQRNIQYVNANQTKISNWISEAHMDGVELSMHHIKGHVGSDDEFQDYKNAMSLLKAGMINQNMDIGHFYSEFEAQYITGNNNSRNVIQYAKSLFGENIQQAYEETSQMVQQVNQILYGHNNFGEDYWTQFMANSGWGFPDLKLYFQAVLDYEECKRYDDRIGTFETYHQQHPNLSALSLAEKVIKDLKKFRNWYKKLNFPILKHFIDLMMLLIQMINFHHLSVLFIHVMILNLKKLQHI